MLGSNVPLRETIEIKYLPKRTYSFSQQKFSCQIGSRNQLKKIESKQSYIYQPMKCSIFNDENYNTMIYQWRKIQHAPIVKVIEITTVSGINSLKGITHSHKNIKPQPIHCQLSNYNKYTKQELLMILKTMLDGHQAIFKKLKATSVSLDKSFISLNGEVKVWINQHLQRNDISGEILNKEEDIVKKIFQTVGFLDYNHANTLNDLINYVNSEIKRNGRWTFSYLRALIKSYSDCLKIKIPTNLRRNEKQPSQYIQYSLIENPLNESQQKKQSQLKKTKQPTMIENDRNNQSSLNCSQNSRRNSQTNNQYQSNGISLNSYNSSRSTTSKSIHQQSQKLKFHALFNKGKHTNSNSKLIKNSSIQKSNLLSSSQLLQLHKQHQNQSLCNHILLDKIGIIPLPEVQDEYCLSPCGKKTARVEIADDKFMISSQFNMKISTNCQEGGKSYKNSTISTNKTSTTGCQFCFSKKVKGSHLDLTIDGKQNKNKDSVYRTEWKDRYTQKIISRIGGQKKTMTSCTNWSNNIQNTLNIDNIVKYNNQSNIVQTKEEQCQDSIRSFSKLQIDKQVLSYKSISDLSSKQLIISSSQQTQRDLPRTCLKNPITYAKQLKSEEQIQSLEKAEKNLTEGDEPSLFDSQSKQRILVQEKLLQLLNLNKKLVISTYMETESQRNKKSEIPVSEQKKKKLKEFEETLNSLMRAKKKQSEILEQNCWKKTLQTLLNLDKQELKQSISVEEANTLIRELKLSKLEKWGREIEKSLIPE